MNCVKAVNCVKAKATALPTVLSAFAALFLFSASVVAYTDVSLTVVVAVDEGGRASVSERALISLDSKEEINEFSYWIASGKAGVVEWKRFSPNVKYHVGGALPPENSRITAKRDFTVSYSAGVIIIEYELESFVSLERVGSRITRYVLKEGVLGFESAAGGGETVLPKDVTLTLALPNDAFVTKLSPEPNKREGNRLTWIGPMTSKWVLEYEKEKPLSDEVNEFFSGAAKKIAELPWQVFAALALLALGSFAFYWLIKRF